MKRTFYSFDSVIARWTRPQRVYSGRRESGAAVVVVDGRALAERKDLKNHSPNGFEWGYAGSGPAQLALALLADHLDDDRQALALYQEFKFKVIAGLPFKGWTLTSQDIDLAIRWITASV